MQISPASGSPGNFRLLAELLSQKREFLRQSALSHIPPFFRSGIILQAVLPSSYFSLFPVRPLRSAIITRFSATMSLSDSRPEPPPGYVFPDAVYALRITPPGLPGSSTNLSTRAAPFNPGESDGCSRPLLPRRCQASSSLADWPLSLCVTRPQGSLPLRLACSPREASPAELLLLTLAWLLVERAIPKVYSFQYTRSAGLILALPRHRGHRDVPWRPTDSTRLATIDLSPRTADSLIKRNVSFTPEPTAQPESKRLTPHPRDLYFIQPSQLLWDLAKLNHQAQRFIHGTPIREDFGDIGPEHYNIRTFAISFNLLTSNARFFSGAS